MAQERTRQLASLREVSCTLLISVRVFRMPRLSFQFGHYLLSFENLAFIKPSRQQTCEDQVLSSFSIVEVMR